MSSTGIDLLLAVFLLAANAFFVAAEFALVKARGFRIDALVEEEQIGARLVQEILGNIEAALDDVFVEALVHISDIGSDSSHYADAKHQLVGERTGRRFRLADRVRVQLVRVDMEASKIDFRLAEEEGGKGRRRG